ncbi:MAG TPA: cation diffusion facilitator family transporter [Chloroflexota bacterium]|jgi:cobalt-zinc-cadmium efflux system protein|nr:cation diffusion facilitator family transporter [Chloroflexota bacterium]
MAYQSNEHPHAPGGGHQHIRADADHRSLSLALGLILAFMIFEVTMAVIGHSLALFADAGHMLTDAIALGASIVASRLALQPARGSWTFGLKRAEVLSAQGNGITLLVVSALIAFEAVQRLIQPPSVKGSVVLVVAVVGIVVNLLATLILARGSRESINVQGSFQHIVTDLYAFIATLIAGLVIVTTGFTRADAIASLIVVVLMLRAAWILLSATGRVLLEAAPAGVDVAGVGRALAARPYVAEIHDLHVWTITSGFPAVAAHVLVARGADCHGIRRDLQQVLDDQYGISHATLQVDHVSDNFTTSESLVATRPVPSREINPKRTRLT